MRYNGWKNDSARVGLNAVIILTGCVLAWFLKTDYDFKGILAITVHFICSVTGRKHRCGLVSSFLLMDSLEMFAALSFYSDLVLQRNAAE